VATPELPKVVCSSRSLNNIRSPSHMGAPRGDLFAHVQRDGGRDEAQVKAPTLVSGIEILDNTTYHPAELRRTSMKGAEVCEKATVRRKSAASKRFGLPSVRASTARRESNPFTKQDKFKSSLSFLAGPSPYKARAPLNKDTERPWTTGSFQRKHRHKQVKRPISSCMFPFPCYLSFPGSSRSPFSTLLLFLLFRET